MLLGLLHAGECARTKALQIRAQNAYVKRILGRIRSTWNMQGWEGQELEHRMLGLGSRDKAA